MSASGKLRIITFILPTQLGMEEAQESWMYATSQVNRSWFAQPFWNLSHKWFISDRRQIHYKIWISKLYEEQNTEIKHLCQPHENLIHLWLFFPSYFESIWVNGLDLAPGFNKKDCSLVKVPILPRGTHHHFGIKSPHLALVANLLTSIIYWAEQWHEGEVTGST